MQELLKITRDISLLYELSLSIGRSLDLDTACMNFLDLLIKRKNLSFASVWVRGDFLVDRNAANYYLVKAVPSFKVLQTELGVDQPLALKLRLNDMLSVNAGEPDFQDFIAEDGISEGCYAVFRLGRVGFLKIWTYNRAEGFSLLELKKLKGVIDKFTTSIEGALAYEKLSHETYMHHITRKELLTNQTRYLNVMNSLKEGLLMTDLDDIILFANNRITELSGYTQEELLGQKAYQLLMQANDHDFVMQAIERRKAGVTETYEIQQVRKDGTIWWARINAAPFVDSKGKIVGTVGALTDISDEKALDFERKANELLLLSVIDSALDGVIIADETGTITHWNKKASQIFGYAPEEVIGQKMENCIMPERFVTAHQKGMHKYLNTGHGPLINKRVVMEAKHKDGHEFKVELTLSALQFNNKHYFSSYIRDLSDNDHTETLQWSDSHASR
jgi:PAS domain S-box-containing protein